MRYQNRIQAATYQIKMVTWVKSVATAIKIMYQQYIKVIETSEEWTFHSEG